MIRREFQRAGKTRAGNSLDRTACVWLEDYSSNLDLTRVSAERLFNPFEVHWWIPSSSTGAVFPTLKEAGAGFDEKVKSLLAKGWEETEASRSRRVFGHPNVRKPTKFWAASLDGSTLILQFGRARPGNPETTGRRKTKTFESPEAARAEYDKLIAQKVREGYKEMWPRATSYSRPAGDGIRRRASAGPAATRGSSAGTRRGGRKTPGSS